MITVALVGPDGAGKSTISAALEHEPLPAPVKRIYMGVNLEASGLMLPTTRLALAVKRARGGTPDMTAAWSRTGGGDRVAGRASRAALRGVRLSLWLAEEWFRQLVATWHRMRGAVVVFDRHFVADYVLDDSSPASASEAVHRWLLRHAYPKPDLVICLDAPGEVLHRRKQEATVEWLERRRRQYLALGGTVPHFEVVDVDRPLDVVVKDVARTVATYCEARRT